MTLHNEPFLKIKLGQKDIELRLCDEKRERVLIGDCVVFKNKDTNETLKRKVVGILKAELFSGLFDQGNTIQRAGFSVDSDIDFEMEKYYTKDQIQKYGIIGFVLKD